MDDRVRFEEDSTWARPEDHVRVTRRPERFDPTKLALVLGLVVLAIAVVIAMASTTRPSTKASFVGSKRSGLRVTLTWSSGRAHVESSSKRTRSSIAASSRTYRTAIALQAPMNRTSWPCAG